MLADLNALLAAHARGEDTTDRFREFMDRHGDLFPEQPKDVDELIDALARRQAAAARMMASLTPEQRAQLSQLVSDALGDPDLAAQMAQLSDNLRALRPGLDRSTGVGMRPGGEPLGYGDAVEAVAELADLESARTSWRRGMPGPTWTTWTWSGSRTGSARRRRVTSRRCASSSVSWSGRATSPAATTGCG